MKEFKIILILVPLIFCSLRNLKSEYYFSLMNDEYPVNIAQDIMEERLVKETREKKSPEKARYIAAVPGFLIHGLGHIYAGDYKTGGLLFSLEGVGILMIMSPFLTGGFDYIILVMFGGGLLFWGTYIWDFTGAPKAAERYNKKYFPEDYTIFTEQRFSKEKVGLTFSINF